MREYELFAQDVDSELDCGFNLRFNEPRNVILQGYPVNEEAVEEAIQMAYDRYPTTEMIMEFDEGEVVGYANFNENGELVLVDWV